MDDYAIPILRPKKILAVKDDSDVTQKNRRSWLQDNEMPVKMKLASNRRRQLLVNKTAISKSLDELTNTRVNPVEIDEEPPPLPERHYSRRGTLLLLRSKSDQQIADHDETHNVNPNGGNVYEDPWDSDVLAKMIQDKMDGLETSMDPKQELQSSVNPIIDKTKSDKLNKNAANQSSLAGSLKNSLDEVDGFRTTSLNLDDIPITATFKVDTSQPLFNQEWYHFECTRESAEVKLRKEITGAFLVRPMALSRTDFSLSIQDGRTIVHLEIIRQSDGKYILGTFSEPFNDVAIMIKFYSTNTLRILKANHLRLTKPVLYSLYSEIFL